MALESNVGSDGAIFAGEAKVMRFEVLATSQAADNPHATMQDVTGWTFRYAWRRRVRGVAPHRTKGPAVLQKGGTDIHVTGAFHADRALNTQRVEVPIAAADTEELAGGDYVDALRRTNDGFEEVLSYGVVPLLVSAS